MQKPGLRAKFLIPTVALVLVGFSLVVWLNTRLTSQSMRAQTREDLMLVCKSIAKDISGDLATTMSTLAYWADEDFLKEDLRKGNAKLAIAHFQHMLKAMTDTSIQYVNIFDAQGELVGTTAKSSNKINVADRDYFVAVVKQGKDSAISKAILSRTTGKKVVILAKPVKDDDGKVMGALTVAIDLDAVTASVNAIKIGSTGFVSIMEKSGVTIAHPNKDLLLKDDEAKTEWGKHALGIAAEEFYEFEDHGTKAVAVVKDGFTGWTFLVFAPYADIQAQLSAVVRQSALIGGGAALLLAVAIVLLTSGVVAKPIAQCVGFASAIAAGRLDERLTFKSDDELGILADALRQMVDKLNTSLDEVKQKQAEALAMAQKAEEALLETRRAQEEAEKAKSQGLLEAASKMSSLVSSIEGASNALREQVERIEAGANTQRDRTTETATAMDEMNATILEISRNASQASLDATNTRDTAQNGLTVVGKAVSAITSVHNASNQMREQMAELGESVRGIDRIIEVISDIADQTNLLALNAAIEAARAGDAGRGFAVVADEVRKLAEKTMIATKEVGQAINAVQMGTKRNIENVQSSTAAIEEANSRAGDSIEALQEVLKLSSSTSDQINSIATAAEEQSGSSAEIDHAMKDIMAIATTAMDSVNDCRETITRLGELSSQLNALMLDLERSGSRG